MIFMVFDVESVGLHGEGFAVGWVVIDSEGEEHGRGLAGCPLSAAQGDNDGRAWVEERVVPALPAPVYANPPEVRSYFWELWVRWERKGALLVSDVPWPVEARFLFDCVKDDPSRIEDCPYPLLDVASILLAEGGGFATRTPRRQDELPAHNPLHDAKCSARQLIEALTGQRAERVRTRDLMETVARLVDRHWTFSDTQQHTHSWHDKQECLESLRALRKADG